MEISSTDIEPEAPQAVLDATEQALARVPRFDNYSRGALENMATQREAAKTAEDRLGEAETRANEADLTGFREELDNVGKDMYYLDPETADSYIAQADNEALIQLVHDLLYVHGGSFIGSRNNSDTYTQLPESGDAFTKLQMTVEGAIRNVHNESGVSVSRRAMEPSLWMDFLTNRTEATLNKAGNTLGHFEGALSDNPDLIPEDMDRSELLKLAISNHVIPGVLGPMENELGDHTLMGRGSLTKYVLINPDMTDLPPWLQSEQLRDDQGNDISLSKAVSNYVNEKTEKNPDFAPDFESDGFEVVTFMPGRSLPTDRSIPEDRREDLSLLGKYSRQARFSAQGYYDAQGHKMSLGKTSEYVKRIWVMTERTTTLTQGPLAPEPEQQIYLSETGFQP